ncbi:MAG: hydrogenase maturation protease [Thermoanaerobaculales bacterium]|nr:hydrogenase maturation protease [Thermoanaerobaculales bacterium]
MKVPDILVVGFGNTLAGDDGAGPVVVENLQRRKLPPRLRVEYCGSDSLVLPSLWQGETEIWLVDALVRRNPPGSIFMLNHDEVLSIPQRHATVHHLSLPESLRWISLTYPEMKSVRYRLWGIEPDEFRIADGLSSEVEKAVSMVADRILDAVSELS